MRIAYITAGAAGMYCGSCLHDNTLAAALQRRGHDVALIPTYTPTRTDEADVSIDRVFFGALNVYLEQRRVFRDPPAPIRWLLDRPFLLRAVSRLAGSAATQGNELGALTLSVLRGEDGRQAAELRRLVDWLASDFRPDIVHITNSMFLGFARTLKRELGVPVLCAVQGEDIFLDELVEPFRTRVREEMQAHATDVDAFIAANEYYARHMAGVLAVAPAKMRVVPLGITLHGHEPGERGTNDPFTIGYLARLCPEKGLHLLLDAFRELAGRADPGATRLRVVGYLGERDRRYVEEQRARVRSWGLEDRVEWLGEVDRAGKMELLRGVDVLTVPTVYRESKGLPVLEALASGVPVVQPDHGCFPEMIAATGGGLLVRPLSATALAEGLQTLQHDPALRRRLGAEGRRNVHARFSDDAMADATLREYAQWVRQPGLAKEEVAAT